MDHTANSATPPPDSAVPAEQSREALRQEVAELIVAALNLEIQPAEIVADDPLYGEGLGLDSIDILEVALEVSKRYGFQLRADNEDNVRIFRSLASLSDHIAQHRTK
jgi:acyl carrier protein